MISIASEYYVDDGLIIHIDALPEIADLIKRQEVFTWQGVDYPQGKPYIVYGNVIKFYENNEFQISRFTSEVLKEKHIAVDLKTFYFEYNGLGVLRDEVSGYDVPQEEKRIDDLLRLILGSQKKWILEYIKDQDDIDNWYEMSVDECMYKIKSNLNRKNQKEGFVVFSQGFFENT
jgi:hypothetical protein